MKPKDFLESSNVRIQHFRFNGSNLIQVCMTLRNFMFQCSCWYKVISFSSIVLILKKHINGWIFILIIIVLHYICKHNIKLKKNRCCVHFSKKFRQGFRRNLKSYSLYQINVIRYILKSANEEEWRIYR